MDYAWKLDSGKKVSLKDFDPSYSGKLKKDEAPALLDKYNQELAELQEILYAAGHNGVLIVLQGMDTSGKDGTIAHVMSHVNPQGCQVTSFKAPTAEELAHDFLWRVHAHTPAKGMMGIFNRSHYEDVLIVRVHDLLPKADWEANYDHINNFEKLLAGTGTLILKFFLHISKDEQAERLQAREDDKDKRWKINAGDYKERNYWDAYQEAYEDLLEKCSTPHAPWYIIPADRKWFRNLAIARTLVETLRPYRKEWEKALEARGEAAYDELLQYRESLKSSDSAGEK
ncbi:MAG: polyphosphate kinase 2 family protein [Chloroflexi bacterium]|nr:polyphosphate kinase 2 family protein [Chloroflexota bacterium]OJV95168.1 MAG: polyphosphate--AMP phosphotransferase [Chloroflexi bacterium 54-19]